MSNVSAGSFTPSLVQDVIKQAEDIFNPANPNPDYVADPGPQKMIMEIQTAKFTELKVPGKDYTMKGVYTDKCSAPVTEDYDVTDLCEISGTEAGQQVETYTLEVHKRSPGFKITDLKFRDLGPTASYTKELAVNLAAEIKGMDEMVAAQAAAKLNSWKGTNLYTGAPGSVSGTTTNIPATAWNPNLFAYFAVTRHRNKLPNAKLFLGGLMEQALVLSELESSTEQGAANVRKVKSLGQVYTDSFVTETQLGGKYAFLVNPDSVGFAHQARFQGGKYANGGFKRNANGKDQILTIVESNAFPGLFYDYIMQASCENGDDIMEGQLFFHGDWFLSPVRCNTSRTGVLRFACA